MARVAIWLLAHGYSSLWYRKSDAWKINMIGYIQIVSYAMSWLYIYHISQSIYIYTHIAHRWSPTPTPSHKGGRGWSLPVPPYIHMYIPAKNPHRQHLPETRVGRHRQNVHGSAADLCHLSAVHGLSPGHWSTVGSQKNGGNGDLNNDILGT